MKLKALYLHGFKSFADKTTIDFHPGVTGIVGPNGCGKSNVVDAIKWVLGETSAKALRGGEMADCIFNGTDKRPAQGLAEVTLTFSDCEESLGVDYNEVAIGRRVYRDGKGEYLINGTQCRLRDIHELFMDTGIGQSAYSVMEQGKIDQLLSSKPEERRAVFEEAAGITKFKTQKREAMRKLEYTESNLLRLSDILAEMKRQMASMQRQAAKARRYQEIHRDVRVLELHLSQQKFSHLLAEKSELETSIHALSLQGEELAAQVNAREAEIQQERDQLEQTDAQLNALRIQVGELHSRVQAARSRMAFNEERRTELEAMAQRAEEEIAASQVRLIDQENELRSAEQLLLGFAETLETKNAEMRAQTERTQRYRSERETIENKLREARRETHTIESQMLAAQSQLTSQKSQLDQDERRLTQLGAEIAALLQDQSERESEDQRLQRELESVKTLLDEQEHAVRCTQDEYKSVQAELDHARRIQRERHKNLATKTSRLEVLTHLMTAGEGLAKGTQYVLGGLHEPETYQSSVHGLLSSYLEVEPEYVRAIEAALGHNLNAVLVSDTTMTETIVRALTQDRLGEVVILPESYIPEELPRQLSTLPEGSNAWAADRVKVKRPVGPIIDVLLGNVLIVPDLSTALALRQVYRDISYATMNGEFVSADGFVRGGQATEHSVSVLQRQNEIAQLKSEVEHHTDECQASDAQVAALEGLVSGLEKQIAEQSQMLQQTRLQESTLTGQLSLLKKDQQNSLSRYEQHQREQSEIKARREAVDQSLSHAQEVINTSDKKLEAQARLVAELEEQLQTALREETSSIEWLNEIRTSLAVEERSERSLRERRDPMQGRIAELLALIERRQSEISSYRDRCATGLAENENLQREIEHTEAQAHELMDSIEAGQVQRTEKAQKIQEMDRDLMGARRQSAAIAEQRGREEVKVTQIALRLDHLTKAITERYQTTLEAFEVDVHTLMSTISTVRSKRMTQEKRRATMNGRSQDGEGDGAESQGAENEMTSEMTDQEGHETWAEMKLEEAPIDWDEVETFVSELRQRLDSMGPVNLDAIQEFEELEERHSFLEKEHNDLTTSKAELLNIIHKINVETRRMFSETFEQIRVNFQKTFKELFGAQGYANLELVNQDDPLESGIDVIAKPPGKKPTSITLLSGGERSMTAVALLFSIYMVKPSPFCVLDELDAPLDEANIGRFLNMLDKFIDKSQFIIVTHNKKTMRRADLIYGVTMEEFGVSKPVGIKMTKEKESTTSRAMLNSPPEKNRADVNEGAPEPVETGVHENS